jgi:ornithine cyclodeaminase/alanine dehydrogenase-like protein (mu-crystallin family)
MGEKNVLSAPVFYVVPGSTVKRVIDGNQKQVFDAVEEAYRLHGSGNTVNPDSYFLRYPDRPCYPLACIEGSLISATRTAASAALAAEHISTNPFEGILGVIGTGVIARTTVEWLFFRNWKFRKISLYDVDGNEAEHFSKWLRDRYNLQADIQDRLEDGISDSSLILFTTTALDPYLAEEKLFAHCPTVLHLSLRDLCVNVILASQNIVDDVDHCLKAKTSLHLTEILMGNRDFVSGSLADVLNKKFKLDHDRPRIFSPFGLGVLDLAVGNFVLEAAKTSGGAIAVPDFFSNSARW